MINPSESNFNKEPVASILEHKKKSRSHYKLQVFSHHVYEYKKGLRNLVLCTERLEFRDEIEEKLQKEHIPYVVHVISNDKINVYFGAEKCVNVVKTFNTEKLYELTDEQDFMLGIMLGYDRLKQCERYLERRKRH